MLMRKRAGSRSFMIKIVLALLTLVIIGALWSQMFNVYNSEKQKAMCKEALRVYSMTNMKGKDALSIFQGPGANTDVPCPTLFVKANGDPEQIKRDMAMHLYDSWDMMHRGTLNLFSNKKGEETYCILTHVVQFGNDAKKIGRVDGFMQYLKDENIPKARASDPDISFMRYLAPYSTSELSSAGSFAQDAGEDDFYLDTGQDYAIMFVYAKQAYVHKIWKMFDNAKKGLMIGGGVALLLLPEPTVTKVAAAVMFGGALGAGVGYETGSDKAADWEAQIVMFPMDEYYLSNLECTYMPGMQATRGS